MKKNQALFRNTRRSPKLRPHWSTKSMSHVKCDTRKYELPQTTYWPPSPKLQTGITPIPISVGRLTQQNTHEGNHNPSKDYTERGIRCNCFTLHCRLAGNWNGWCEIGTGGNIGASLSHDECSGHFGWREGNLWPIFWWIGRQSRYGIRSSRGIASRRWWAASGDGCSCIRMRTDRDSWCYGLGDDFLLDRITELSVADGIAVRNIGVTTECTINSSTLLAAGGVMVYAGPNAATYFSFRTAPNTTINYHAIFTSTARQARDSIANFLSLKQTFRVDPTKDTDRSCWSLAREDKSTGALNKGNNRESNSGAHFDWLLYLQISNLMLSRNYNRMN